ncbi:MAG: hypothetical protein AAF092_06735 [Pseudomonadota bacterium]
MAGSMNAQLTFFFVVDPPKYQNMGCYLAASIRTQFDEPVKLVGYCPATNLDKMDPKALAIYDALDVDIRPMETEGRFDEPYPHGNKLLAALEPRDTPYSAFMDSDMVYVGKNTVSQIAFDGHVSVAAATSLYWAGQDIWDPIYAACEMEPPTERIWLQRQRRRKMMPYFNAGLIVFPEGPRNAHGESFAQIWYRLARQIDARADVPKKRPYLDQMSLPPAIRAAGLDWHLLPEEQHYILGGVLRGKPLPEDKSIKLLHYRKIDILKEVDKLRYAKKMLEDLTGVRRIDKMPVPKDASET